MSVNENRQQPSPPSPLLQIDHRAHADSFANDSTAREFFVVGVVVIHVAPLGDR